MTALNSTDSVGNTRFWRHHPSRTPESNPHTNALYLPTYSPRLGDNLLDEIGSGARAISRFWMADWLDHEFAHVQLSLTPAYKLQKALAHSIYLVLSHLSGDMVLHVPSWELTGHNELARIMPKLKGTLECLVAETSVIDETICSAITLTNYRMFANCGITDESKYGEAKGHVKKDKVIWAYCERFLKHAWFRRVDDKSFVSIRAMLCSIALYAFSPPMEALNNWAQGGLMDGTERPLARFEFVLDLIDKLRSRSVGGAIRRLQRAQVIQTPVDIFDETDEDNRFLNPWEQVCAALGLDPKEALVSTPVGRAREHLLSGFGSTFSDWTSPIPLVEIDDEDGNIGAARCQYSVRVPLGRIAVRVLSGSVSPAALWERLLGGDESGLRLNLRLTVMPVEEDIRLLCNLDRVCEQLLFGVTLNCLCGLERCFTAACRCKTILSNLYDHVRMDDGQKLKPIPCLT